MRKTILVLFLTLVYGGSFAQDYPAKPTTLVNDYTGTLSETQKQQLENKLVLFDDSTSNQIAIAIVKSVGEYDINEYALGLGRKWGVGGDKKKNNGVMIVVSLGDRKISMQTGYGLEGALPDIITQRIIENEIKPHFKAGDYYGGLDAGTTAIIKYTKGEYKNDNPKAAKKSNGSGILVLIVIIIIIVIIIRRGGGNGGQVIGGRGIGEGFLLGMLMGGGGRSSGGNWGGGSGNSGGGGFGGFGGGSFGGGGSSGSW